MISLQYTLLSDGPTDTALIPIIDFLLHSHGVFSVQSEWADIRQIGERPQTLSKKIEFSLIYYPCNLLFVHRDAEREEPVQRYDEVKTAMGEAKISAFPPYVSVVPRRMTEAWLLVEEQAIRHAASNPNGKVKLDLPKIQQLEQLPNPKEILHSLLREASGFSGRRLRQFSTSEASKLVAEYIQDFSPLRRLPAFQRFENDVKAVIEREGWSSYAG